MVLIQVVPRPVYAPTNKRKAYTLETKQFVYNAVKDEGLNHAEAALRFGIVKRENHGPKNS